MRRRQHGYSMLDVLVTLSITTVLMAALMPALSKSRGAGDRVACMWNLRQIGVGMALYAADNHNRMPDPASSQKPWETMLRRYTTPQTYRCIADQELFAALHTQRHVPVQGETFGSDVVEVVGPNVVVVGAGVVLVVGAGVVVVVVLVSGKGSR